MSTKYNTLIMGASYGSLLGIKLALAGHSAKMVCLPDEATLFNEQGARVRMPIRGREGLVEIDSRGLPGELSAAGTGDVNPSDYDLIALAMQEPQYRLPGVRELLDAIGKSGVPCMSIMNMPPPPFLARIPGLDASSLADCYTDFSVWQSFDPALITLCSPDPQAFRPPQEKTNVLQVSLPTNFKAARFESDAHTAILRQMQADIEAIRFDTGDGKVELPVKLKVHESIFVPLAKWCMLLTGNYRCVHKDGMVSIKEAVHSDIELSRSVYNWVSEVCRSIGADPADQVPFEKYASAAMGLTMPSSGARGLAAGAKFVERADSLVRTIGAQKGMQHDAVDEAVGLVDFWLEKNRKAG